MIRALLLCLAPTALLGLVSICSAQDRPLYDFSTDAGLTDLITTGANVTRHRGGLRVTTGVTETWPGMTLRSGVRPWDLSEFQEVAVLLKNTSTNVLTVFCRVDNPGADGTKNCVTGSASLQPGHTNLIRVELKRASDDKLGGKLFGMRGYPVSISGPGKLDPKNVTQLLLFLSKPKAEHTFEILDVRAQGKYVAPTAWTSDASPFFPLIDTFGQYRHKNWPGKVKDHQDLVSRPKEELVELQKEPGPANWDKYGGWNAGPTLKATGFFRAEKVGNKWWLVDPDGHLFFSQGIDCVRMLDSTPIDQRDTWFEDFPGARPEFASFVSTGFALKGHYAGQRPKCFSFAGANLVRKYGAEYQKTYPPLIHRRLRSWGLNTIANWSDSRVYLLRQTAYTDTVGTYGARMLEGSEGYWGKFPDVYDPGFQAGIARAMAQKKGASAGDPWCIGYFSDNEMSWGDELSLALATLKSSSEQPAKQVFVADLRAKYGEIAALNRAWGSSHASWDGLLQGKEAPDKEKAREDLEGFYTKTAETYFRTVRERILAEAPHQLYLGCRFAWVNARAAAAAAKYCHVVSYNLYQRSVADFKFNGGADVPLIIGEFHFGALDRGMFHTGLVPVADQQQRAQSYRDYVLGALRHPQFVGCHWFQYQDEPTTGRVYDEENYQIGFVDIVDTPYVEMIQASRSVAKELYR